MRRNRGVAAVIAAVGLAVANPAAAGTSGERVSSAEQVRRLDIMLMVTGLRCRTSADNFQADYSRFTSKHIAALNRANAQLRDELAVRHGRQGAAKALDRLGVTMANSYGQGHPWLGCAELRMVARNLAGLHGSEPLADAAEQLLGPARPGQFALMGR